MAQGHQDGTISSEAFGAGDTVGQAGDVAGCAGRCSLPGASFLQGSAGDDCGTPGWDWWQENGSGQGPVLAAHSGLCHGKQLLPGEGV